MVRLEWRGGGCSEWEVLTKVRSTGPSDRYLCARTSSSRSLTALILVWLCVFLHSQAGFEPDGITEVDPTRILVMEKGGRLRRKRPLNTEGGDGGSEDVSRPSMPGLVGHNGDGVKTEVNSEGGGDMTSRSNGSFGGERCGYTASMVTF